MRGTTLRLFAAQAAALCAALPFAANVQAQGTGSTYPVKAIRYIVPFAPSGTGDVCARYHAQHLQERLGQPVVVENRAGAGQAIGIEAAAKAAPDGYTVLQGALSGLVLNTLFVKASGKKLPYDVIHDLTPISMVCTSPLYLAVHASIPVRTVKELVAYAKENPGKLTYSSNGIGGTQHLGMELFANKMGIKLLHVPYKSGAQSTSDMVSGVVKMLLGGALLLPQAKAGKVRVLASGGKHRTRATPNVPTMQEAGVEGYDVSSWFALVAPTGVPQPIIDRLYRETAAIMKSATASASNDIEYTSSTPEELAQRITDEMEVWTKVIRDVGIKPES
jgi:tripartite-type tricarboxylate transporter receptor subunit TctC